MNRARSNIKLKEYAAAGACWLASPIGPYVGLGEKQGGRLVARRRLARRARPPARQAARAREADQARRQVGRRRDAHEERPHVGGALRGGDRASAGGHSRRVGGDRRSAFQLHRDVGLGMLGACASPSSPTGLGQRLLSRHRADDGARRASRARGARAPDRRRRPRSQPGIARGRRRAAHPPLLRRPRASAIAREAKANGAAVVWDNDDNRGLTPRGVAQRQSLERLRRGSAGWPRMRRLLSDSSTSSRRRARTLAEQLRATARRTHAS